MKSTYVAVLTLAVTGLMSAQEYRGTISGAALDPSGAAVAGAKVTVLEIQTNTKTQTVTESTGQYTAPFLLPGDYQITVQMQGFREAVQKGIHLGAGEHPVIDIKLAVGEATQTVEVTANAPMINSENASVGNAITTKEVENLPLNGGSSLMLAQLEIGVVYSPFNSASTVLQTYDSSNNFSLAGTPTQSSEMLLNGAPNATWDMRSAYTPPKDAVQEVRVMVVDTDAGFGHTRGGTINQILKSGTNELHGSAFEYTQPSLLTANSFFNNAKGLGNPVTHFNQFGLTAGGPVRIPKVYNGKDKLFWFFAWQHDINSTPFTAFISVPTAAERKGDFSQILQTDGTKLYDPYSGAQNGTAISRSPLPNNRIPDTRFDTIAQKYLQFLPPPNTTPLRPDGYQNFGTTAPNTNSADNQIGILDYNMSAKSKVSFNIRHNTLFAKKNDYFQNIASGQITWRENWGTSLDEVYTINTSNMVNLRLNYTYMFENASDPSEGFDPTSLGFPSYMAGNSSHLALPYVYFDTSTSFQSMGFNQATKRPSQTLQLYATWTKVAGNHTIHGGADVRQARLSAISYAMSAGGFNFGGNRWVNSDATTTQTEAFGQDMAQFLYGLPTQGFYDINSNGSWYSYFASGFVQDDWRVRRNLTINVGLRYDYDGPFHEKWGRSVNGWAFGAPNPIAAAASAAYDKAPIAQIPAGSFKVLGGLTYPSIGGPSYDNTSHLTSPRVGLAWSPERFHGKTVIRTAFGMFTAPTTLATLAQNGNYSSIPVLNQEGFSQETTMNVSTNNYVSPGPATFSDPFPGGAIVRPSGTPPNQTAFLGQAVSFLNPEVKTPYSLRWNFGFQESLSPNMVLEAVYIGNHSVHTPINLTQLNGIPRQYLSTLPTRDAALNTAMSASVADPFNGLIASGTPSGSKITVAQLLSFYPEFPLGYSSGGFTGSGGVLEQGLNAGSSYFHSLNVRFQRRFSGGLMIIANYIFSKLMEETTWLNDTDPRPEKRIGVFDHTHRGVIAMVYELPFGTGKAVQFRSRLANSLLGGWNLTAVYTKQSGQPFTWMGTSSTTIGDLVYYGDKLHFDARQTNGLAFNTSAFNTTSAGQFAYHIRTFSTTFSSLRGDGMNEMNTSLLKQFALAEDGKCYLQIRGEFFNVMNRPSFAFPNLAPTNSAFGLISAQSNRSRQIQLGARLVF
jgi:hypothetical protein